MTVEAVAVPTPKMRTSAVLQLQLTYDQAVAFIRQSRKQTLYFYVANSARLKDQTGEPFYKVRTEPLAAYIDLPKSTILKLLNKLYTEQVRNRTTVCIHDHGSCLFIGE